MKIFDPKLTGSIEILNTITGNVTIAGGLNVVGALGGAVTASVTASYVEYGNVVNKPTLLSGSAQIASDISGSFTLLSSSLEQRVSSNETSVAALNSATSSYLLNTTDTFTGDLTVTGTITAQEFHTEFVSASVIYQSGSTQFGNSSDDTHIFTGSVSINRSGASTSDLKLGPTFYFGSKAGDYLGQIGWNRDVVNGNILDSNFSAHQIHNYQGNLNHQIYASNGNFVTAHSYDSTGNVGIGIGNGVSPRQRLDVRGKLIFGGTGASYYGQPGNFDTGSNGDKVILYSDSGTSYNATIGVGNASNLWFKSQGDAAEEGDIDFFAGGSQRVRIKGNGHVGIGTTSPGYRLSVISNGSTYSADFYQASSGTDQYNAIRVRGAMTSTVGYYGIGGSTASNTSFRDAFVVGTQSAHSFNLNTSDTARLTILSGGNVGIGTTSPSEKLHVTGNLGLGTNPFIKWTSNTLTFLPFGDYIPVVKLGGTTSYSPRFEMYNAGDASNVIMLNAGGNSYINSGNVGIGTTSPATNLHISSTASTPTVRIETTHPSGIPLLDLKGAASSQIRYIDESGTIQTRIDMLDNGGFSFIDVAGSASARMVINSSGNVGIGTTSPNAKLDVIGNIRSYFTQTGITKIQVGNSVASSGDGAVFEGVYGSTQISALGFNWTGAAFESYLDFYERLDIRNQSDSILMSVLSGGNVGIGTTSPSSILTLKDNFSNGVAITLDRTENAVVDNLFYIGVSSAGSTLTDFLWLGTSTTSFAVKANGDVGIGTTTPNGKLHINTGTAGITQDLANQPSGTITFSNNSGGTAVPTITGKSSNNVGLYLSAATPDSPAASMDMLFDVRETDNTDFATLTSTAYRFARYGNSLLEVKRNGNVGISTTSPIRKLHIDGGSISSDTPTVRISSTDSSGTNKFGIEFYSNNGADIRGKVLADNNGRVYIDDNGGGGVVLQANGGTGHVAIGTNGVQNYTPKTLMIGNGSTDGMITGFSQPSGTGSNSVAGRNLIIRGGVGTGAGANGDIIFKGADTLVYGNQLPHAEVERVRILSSGGITFNGDTAAANALDDYEEGTWNPVLEWSTGSSYTMTGITAGRYTKVGNQVFVSCQLAWNAFGGTTSGNLVVTGLPYTIGGGIRYAGSISALPSGISFSSSTYTQYTITGDPGYTYFYIIQQGSGQYSHAPTVATSGIVYSISLTYRIS